MTSTNNLFFAMFEPGSGNEYKWGKQLSLNGYGRYINQMVFNPSGTLIVANI